MVLAVACGSGCLTVKKLSIMNGMVTLEYGNVPVPTLYQMGGYEKTEDGTAMNIIHMERDPSTLDSEENPETPVISP